MLPKTPGYQPLLAHSLVHSVQSSKYICNVLGGLDGFRLYYGRD